MPNSRRRLRGQGTNVALLLVVWLLLNGNLAPLTVLTGLLLSAAISWVFPLPPIQWGGRLRPLGLLMLLGRLLFDLALASTRLALAAFNPRTRPRSGVLAVPLRSDADLYQVGTSSLLTIVPGSVVVDARRKTRTLYLHVFDMEAEEACELVEDALRVEGRVLRAFASPAEIARAREEER